MPAICTPRALSLQHMRIGLQWWHHTSAAALATYPTHRPHNLPLHCNLPLRFTGAHMRGGPQAEQIHRHVVPNFDCAAAQAAACRCTLKHGDEHHLHMLEECRCLAPHQTEPLPRRCACEIASHSKSQLRGKLQNGRSQLGWHLHRSAGNTAHGGIGVRDSAPVVCHTPLCLVSPSNQHQTWQPHLVLHLQRLQPFIHLCGWVPDSACCANGSPD